MTILRIIDRLNVGGPAIHAVLLTKHMNGANPWRTILVTGQEGEKEGSMLPWAESQGVHPVRIGSLGRELNPWRDIAAFIQLFRIIRRERPSVVHTHKSKAGALGRLAAWLCGVPVMVHTFHGHVLHGYFGTLKSRIFISIERMLARVTDSLIAVSPRVKDDLVRYKIAPAERIEVMPLGLDLSRFAAQPRRAGGLRPELKLPPDAPLVGIVARLVPIKDVLTFLRMAALVGRAVPAARFVVVGDGELREELEARCRDLGLDERVRFLGFRVDLEKLYSDIDVLVLTSLNEGSPVSLIEGLAAACPVAATDVGGVRDVVQDGISGLLVSPGDFKALAQAVARLIADPALRQKMGEAGRKDILERYGIQRLTRDMNGLYLRLLEKKGGIIPLAK